MLPVFGSIDANWGEQIINNYTLAFFDRYLNSQNSPLLNSPASNYPEVQSSSRLVTGSNVDQLTVNTHNSLQITKVGTTNSLQSKTILSAPSLQANLSKLHNSK